jgi:hypothetical protein
MAEASEIWFRAFCSLCGEEVEDTLDNVAEILRQMSGWECDGADFICDRCMEPEPRREREREPWDWPE